jgi:hypothetical protein
MRYILTATLLMTVSYVSPASAGDYGCGPAVQNWKNGSQTTCTYDSNGGAIEVAAPAPTPAAPPPTQVEDECQKEGYGDYGNFKSYEGFRSFKSFKGTRGYNHNPA